MNHSNEIPKNSTDTRVIYILKEPKSNAFFIGHCRRNQLKSVFQAHYYGNRYQTQALCDSLKEKNLHPCLFVLEELFCSKEDAFHHVTAWTKIFHDAGWDSLNQGNVSEYINNMNDETTAIYNQWKATDLSQLITCNKCLVAYYASKKCLYFSAEESGYIWDYDEDHTTQVKTRVSSEEKKQIQRNAQACGMSQSAYLRSVALDMVLITVDDAYIKLQTESIKQASEAIWHLVFSMYRNNQFLPKDLDYIYAKAREIVSNQKILLQEQREHSARIEKSISETVQDAVEKKLNEQEHHL